MKNQAHTPFEMNELNAYLWQRKGKKHFWGIRGKDYGFMESPNKQKRAEMAQLRNEHANYQYYQPQPKQFAFKEYAPRQFPPNARPQNNQSHLKIQKNNMEQYFSEHPARIMNTEPIQYTKKQVDFDPRAQQTKRRHLSLMSRNIDLVNDSHPNPNRQVQSRQDQPRMPLQNKKQLRVRTEIDNYEDIEKYRDRIVKIVRKDRKNNPTFCNSLAYPLHCYRYIE